MNPDTIMKVRQIAEYLQTDEHTIYRLARKGQIPAFKLSGQWRFKKDLIDKWIEKKSFENSRKPLKEASS
jgi:excisionase family DNA binding protein